MKEKQGDMRVWWIPQVPGKQYLVSVRSLEQAKLVLKVLAEYDLFQLAHNIKPDFSNAGGLCVLEGDTEDDWCDFESEDGLSIDDLTMEECIALDEKSKQSKGVLR